MPVQQPRLVVWTDHALAKTELLFEGYDSATVVAEQTEFGLRELDPNDMRLVGLEYWHASQALPADFLRMLPSPPVSVSR